MMKALLCAMLLFAVPAVAQLNVIVVMTDDQSIYNSFNANAMPYLFSKPYGHWITFDQAFIHTPLCCPSRATLFTGRYSERLTPAIFGNADATRFALSDNETLALWLNRAGYHTAIFGKYVNSFKPSSGPPTGFEKFQVFINQSNGGAYENYDLWDGSIVTHYGTSVNDYSTDVLRSLAISFLNETAEPFFLVVTPYAPHGGVHAPQRYNSYPMPARPIPISYNESDMSDKPSFYQDLPLLGSWDGKKTEQRAILAVDDLIEAIIENLHASTRLDNTVIIFYTDNGIQAGQHRLKGKERVYEESVHTPLMIRYPGAAQHTDTTHLISNVDFAPTITEVAGATATLSQDGYSIVPILEGNNPQWRGGLLLSTLANGGGEDFYAIRTLNYKYVEYSNGEKELYNMVLDPNEMESRHNDPVYAAIKARLAVQLAVLKQ